MENTEKFLGLFFGKIGKIFQTLNSKFQIFLVGMGELWGIPSWEWEMGIMGNGKFHILLVEFGIRTRIVDCFYFSKFW
jgi:hypothetical protein